MRSTDVRGLGGGRLFRYVLGWRAARKESRVDPLIAVDGEGAHVMQVCNESDKEKYPSW